MSKLDYTPREDRQYRYYADILERRKQEFITATNENILHEATYPGDDAPYPKRFKWLSKKTILKNKLKMAVDNYSKALIRLTAFQDVAREDKILKARGEK